jgi:hypothetical protein
MFVTRLVLKNWRNFVDVDVSLREYVEQVGLASGISS